MTVLYVIVTLVLMLVTYAIGRWQNTHIKESEEQDKKIKKLEADIKAQHETINLLKSKLSSVVSKYNALVAEIKKAKEKKRLAKSEIKG